MSIGSSFAVWISQLGGRRSCTKSSQLRVGVAGFQRSKMNSQFHLHLTELDMKRSDWVLNFNLSSCLSLYVYICAHMYIYRCDYNWLHTYMWFYIHIIHTHFSGWDFRVEIISPVLWGASGTIPRSVRAMACHRAELPLQVRRWMDQCDGKHGIFNGVWCFNQWDHIYFFVLESCFFV